MTAQDPNKPDKILRLARRSDRCTVLGPGVRAVLWVQGCPFRCRECLVPEMLPFRGGHGTDVDQLAEELARLPGIEGLTFSGGEPMAQAPAINALVDGVRRRRDLSLMSYTGYRFEWLRAKGTAAQRELLDRLDILVDGPYLPQHHTDRLWRGSDNQRVLLLTDRHVDWGGRLDERGPGVELEVGADGIGLMGIPPRGLRQNLETRLYALGGEIHFEERSR